MTQAAATSLTPDYSRRCAGCAHRLAYGTCAEPERAGLIPPGHGFGIVWPPPVHAATCEAFDGRGAARLTRSGRH